MKDERDTLLALFKELRQGGMQKNAGIAELIDAGRVLAGRPLEIAIETWISRLAPSLVKLKSDLPVFKLALDAVLAARAKAAAAAAPPAPAS